eukprot:12911399-Prorocentrum_lima.AAC.1
MPPTCQCLRLAKRALRAWVQRKKNNFRSNRQVICKLNSQILVLSCHWYSHSTGKGAELSDLNGEATKRA